MIPFANPYILLGAAGAALALSAGSFYAGHHWATTQAEAERAKMVAAQLEVERVANKALTEANDRASKSDERFAKIQQDMEKKQHENQAIIDAAHKQLSTIKRLRDPGSRSSDCGDLPKNTTAPGDPVDATPPGYLSDEFTEFLREQAYAADQVSVYAKTCHDWVVSIDAAEK